MWPFKKKSLEAHLRAKKKVNINGVEFIIQRINILDHLTGAKVMTEAFQSYQVNLNEAGKKLDPNWAKIEEHMRDVIIAGVASPKISRKPEDSKILVDDLFLDWGLVNRLYEAIMAFTNGKKKILN